MKWKQRDYFWMPCLGSMSILDGMFKRILVFLIHLFCTHIIYQINGTYVMVFVKKAIGCHDSVCVWTSMAFIKTHLLSWINIAMFSKLCWLFLNSEIISSLCDTHKNISKINVPFQLLCIAHTCAESYDLIVIMTFYGLFTFDECRERI